MLKTQIAIKAIQFKSLTFRIWTTFIVFSIGIILAISLLYLGIFKRMEQTNKMESLAIGHEIILEDNRFEPGMPRTVDFKKIAEMRHIVLTELEDKLEVIAVDRRAGMPPDALHKMGRWFLSFTKGETVYKKQGKGVFQNQEILFIMSTIESPYEGKLVLVSYITYASDNSLLWMVIGIGMLFIFIALIVSKVISNYISKPLKRLEEQALKIANKDWIEPIVSESTDEIGRLIHSINYMQKALQQADKEERKFLQSISHDLKTPIMVIMGHAQAIQDGMYVESLENTAEIIKTEAVRLENKVKQILYFNTLDYLLENEIGMTEIDFKKLLNHIITRFETINPSIQWQVELEKLMIYGNGERLQIAIENILDNQLRYAKSLIRIEAKEEKGEVRLTIYNDGPPISVKDLEHIFEELYKDSTGKFGLGLAITKKIITYYGGRIQVSNGESGVFFIISIPLILERECY